MKIVVKIIYIFLAVSFIGYLALPNFQFPAPPTDALQSDEPADIESSVRRAYFTNYTRSEIIAHYKKQMGDRSVFRSKFLSIELNYPPEEAQTIIRDQTRSTFLEEIAHPFRESIYINGFEPANPKDAIFIDNRSWRQKITVKYVQSEIWTRILVGLLIVLLTPLFINFCRKSLIIFTGKIKWIFQ